MNRIVPESVRNDMKLLAAAILVIQLAATALFSQESFRYDNDRAISPGTVLHYLKTNIDGTHPEYVSQYFPDAETIEAFKFHPHETPAGYVVAKMDWKFFDAASLKSWQIFGPTERKLFGTIDLDNIGKKATVKIPAAQEGKRVDRF